MSNKINIRTLEEIKNEMERVIGCCYFCKELPDHLKTRWELDTEKLDELLDVGMESLSNIYLYSAILKDGGWKKEIDVTSLETIKSSMFTEELAEKLKQNLTAHFKRSTVEINVLTLAIWQRLFNSVAAAAAMSMATQMSVALSDSVN